MKNITILILTSLLLFTACRKPHSINTDANKSWQPVETIDELSKNITNCLVVNNSLYLSSSDYLIHYQVEKAFGVGASTEKNVKRPLSSNYYSTVNSSNGIIGIHPYTNPIVGLISPEVVGEDYTLWVDTYSNTDFAAFNSNLDQILVSVLMEQGFGTILNFLLVNFNETSGSLTIDSVQIIKDLNQGGGSYLPGVYSFFGKYFVTLTSGLVLINEDGATWNANGLSSNLYLTRMYQIGESIFLVSKQDIYISDDKGENWRLYYSLPFTFNERNYYVIDDELIVAEKDKLSRLITNIDGEFELEVLPVDGLENNSITDIVKFEGEIIVSTFSGTFSKSYAEFVTGK